MHIKRIAAAAAAMVPGLVFLAILLVSIHGRFHEWQPVGLWGDDIYNLVHFNTGSAWEVIRASFAETYFQRYRPIFGIAWGAWWGLFGMDMWKHHVALIVLQAINACLFGAIALRLSGRRYFLVALLTLVFACSRFAFFQVISVTGIIEALALVFFLLMLWAVTILYQDPGRAPAMRVAAVAAFVLAVFTHERYLAAAPWLSLMLWHSFPKGQGGRARWVWAAAPWLVLVANVLVKIYALDAHFLMGTGGPQYDFDAARTLLQLTQGLKSLMGINRGQEYLVGQQSRGLLLLVGVVFGATFLVAMARGLRRASREQRFFIASFALLAALLLGPPVLTIRLEQRWLFAPLGMMLLGLAWTLGRSRTAQSALLVLACCASLAYIDRGISRYFGLTFMGYGADMGAFAAEILRDGSAGPPGTPIVVQTRFDGCISLHNGLIFEVMEKQPRQLACIDDIRDARLMARWTGARLFIGSTLERHTVFKRGALPSP